MRDVVIYTQRVEVQEHYQERRDCADQRVADFLYKCGYLPIPVPNRMELADDVLSTLHPKGIVLTGGNSLAKYGGNAPERDLMDETLIRLSLSYNIPVYGLCRGMQSLLDYFGCKLSKVNGHVAVRHKIYGNGKERNVNSFHNFAAVSLESDDLVAEYHSDDGVIEMVRHAIHPMVGVMWHPEREKDFSEQDIQCIVELFK